MQRVRFGVRSLPWALALTAVVAYGSLLPLTGFYWDDWPFAWIARFQGPAEFFPAFQGFRPFLAPIFYFTTTVLPAIPAAWQVAALAIHVLAAWSAWWCLEQVWPRERSLTVSVALLFLVFPGYSQHWVAFTHINQEWISLIAYLLSVGVSLQALRNPATAVRATLAALILECVGLLPTEYFATLEPVRGLLFLVVFSSRMPDWRSRGRALLGAWWPYLLLWLLNGVWLTYFYTSGAYISYDLAAAAAPAAPMNIIWIFADALWKAGVYVWIQVVPLTAASMASPTNRATWAVVLVVFLLLGTYLTRLQLSTAPPRTGNRKASGGISSARSDGARSGWQGILIGLTGIALGRVPSFVAGLPLTLQSSFDRLTISMMFGAALFVAGASHMVFARSTVRMYVVATLVALAVGQQFLNANTFRRDWERQQEIYWQFAWRMPDILPDTAILTQQMPLDYETDLGMTAALNWIYVDDVQPPHLPLAMVYTEKRLGGVVLPALEAGLPMEMPLRTMTFRGNTSQAIVVYVPANGCLRVFDPDLDDAATYSRLPEAVTAAIPLSDPGRIVTDTEPRRLPRPPFAAEPPHGWCYIYEQAELARQRGDWQEIVALRAEAERDLSSPEDPFEWLPFLEAEARAGKMEWATQMSLTLLHQEPKLERGLCALWSRVALASTPATSAASARLRSELSCE